MNSNIRILFALLFSCGFFATSLSAQQWASGYGESLVMKEVAPSNKNNPENSYGNFSVSHGHCQTPFTASLTNVRTRYHMETLEGLGIDFEVDNRTIVAGGIPSEKLTSQMKNAANFDIRNHPTMGFISEDTYYLGKEWYQLNGKLTIKGVSRPASFHARPIYGQEGGKRVLRNFVLDGEIDLRDYEITGSMVEDADVKARIMYMNLVVEVNEGC